MKLTDVIYSTDKLRENRVLMLRQESFAPVEFIQNAVLSFKESAMKMKDYLLLVRGFKGEDKTLSSIRSKIEKAEKELLEFNFVSNHRMLVPVPVGFDSKGQMVDYAELLEQSISVLVEKVKHLIDEFNGQLSVFISDRSTKTSLRDNGSEIKHLKAEREKLSKEVARFFTNGTNSRCQLGDIYLNTSSVILAAKKSLWAYERAYHSKPDVVNSDIEVICRKIDTIINMAEGPDDFEVSPEAIRNLAEKSYEIGRLVEQYAVFCAMSETAAVLTDETLERMLKEI